MKGLFLQSQIFLAGICFFVAIHHFTIKKGRSERRVHLLFSSISLLMALHTISNVQTYMQTTLADYIPGVTHNLRFLRLVCGPLPTVCRRIFRSAPKAGAGRTLRAAGLALHPQSNAAVYHSEIREFKHITLPEGTEISIAVGTYNASCYLWKLFRL